MPSCQFEESFRISQMSKQAADSVAYLRLGYPEGIGTLPLQLENPEPVPANHCSQPADS